MGITRAFIHHLAAKETVGAHLLTMHNVHHLLSLMASLRAAIVEERFPGFVQDFFKSYYANAPAYPPWAVKALQKVNIDLNRA